MGDEYEPHRTEIKHGPISHTYWAECSCGYVGPSFTRKSVAEDDADDHVLAITASE